MKRCINKACNAELEDYQERCTECGWSQKQKVVEKPAPMREEETSVVERHGCVTAWLWFAIIVNTFVSFTALFPKQMWGAYYPNSLVPYSILSGVLGICAIIGAFMILRWKKVGFYVIVVASVLANVIMLVATGTLPTGLIGILILWAVLQIKKNGVSCWKALK